MHFSLIMIGAHDGSKNADMIREACGKGKVLLLEPVPFLFSRLKSNHASSKEISVRNIAISMRDGESDFTAPKPSAVNVAHWGERLGSLIPGHALAHSQRFAEHVEVIKVQTARFETLFKMENVSSIDCLWTDAKGLDVELLLDFPFSILMPQQIIFEFKHADGVFRVGEKLARLLFLLEELGYNTSVFDAENMKAVRRITPAAGLKPVSRDLTSARAPAPRFASVRGWSQAEIPVLVPCFNNPTYTRGMLGQLLALGFHQIVLVDNASTSPDMRIWLDGLEDEATVITLPDNFGPHHIFKDPRNFALLPRRFCITDPDLSFNPALPEGFLGELSGLVERHRVGKAGFALDISDRELMRDELFRIAEKDWKIWEWEAQFWDKPLEPLADGDAVYAADIDTTFALYDKNHFDPGDYMRAVRVAGRFTARHLPWYRDRGLPEAEAAQYARAEKFSYYMKERSQRPDFE